MQVRLIAAWTAVVLCAGAVTRADTIEFASSGLTAVSTGPDSLVLVDPGGGTTEQFVNGLSVGTLATTDFTFAAVLGASGTPSDAVLLVGSNGTSLQTLVFTAGTVDFSGAGASTFQFAGFLLDGSPVDAPLNLSFLLPSGWVPSETPFVEGVTARVTFDTAPAVVPLPAAGWAGLVLLGGVAGVRRFTGTATSSAT